MEGLSAGERLRLAALTLNRLQTMPTETTLATTLEPALAKRPRPTRGRSKIYQHFMAADFDAPLDGIRGVL